MMRSILMLFFALSVSTASFAQEYITKDSIDDGFLYEQQRLSLDSTLLCSRHYVYDNYGALIMVIQYNYKVDERVVEGRNIEIYKHGRIVSRQEYTADDMLLFEEILRYNRYGDLKRRKQINYEAEKPMVTIERRKYTYKKGIATSARYYINGELYFSR